jgi:hypothetical protein
MIAISFFKVPDFYMELRELKEKGECTWPSQETTQAKGCKAWKSFRASSRTPEKRQHKYYFRGEKFPCSK